MQLTPGGRGHPLCFGNRYTRDPDDLLLIRDDGQAIAEVTGNVSIYQDVLQTLRRAETQRSHPVARLAGADGQGRLDEVAVQVADLVPGFERGRVAAAGREGQLDASRK